jgi:endonuclease III
MTLKQERATEIVHHLRRMYRNARVALDFRTAFELLIATILSAQSTDVRVNAVTKDLFRKYPTPEALAGAKLSELEKEIHSTGFYKNKAKLIAGASKAIVERHGGRVPDSMEELVAIPGVGRKTANVVLGNAFGKPVGIVVDTHVARLAARLGFTRTDDPVKIEQDLMKLVPQKEWIRFANALILHGRQICVARSPRCRDCRLNDLCPSAEEPEV